MSEPRTPARQEYFDRRKRRAERKRLNAIVDRAHARILRLSEEIKLLQTKRTEAYARIEEIKPDD